jgi:hypothetical protein
MEAGQLFVNKDQPIKYAPIKIMAVVDGYVMAQKIEIGHPFVMEELEFKTVFIDACGYKLSD